MIAIDTKSLPFQLIQTYGMNETIAIHLAKTYGGRAWEVCKVAESMGKHFNKQLLSDEFPYIEAEVIWACNEYACTIEDVLSRRTRLAFLNRDVAAATIPKVANLMADTLGWSHSTKKQQIAAAQNYIMSYGGRNPVV